MKILFKRGNNMKIIENIKTFLTATFRLFILFMVYNFLLLFILCSGILMFSGTEKYILSILAPPTSPPQPFTSFMKTLIEWSFSHASISIPIIIILYIGGFFLYLYHFALIMWKREVNEWMVRKVASHKYR